MTVFCVRNIRGCNIIFWLDMAKRLMGTWGQGCKGMCLGTWDEGTQSQVLRAMRVYIVHCLKGVWRMGMGPVLIKTVTVLRDIRRP